MSWPSFNFMHRFISARYTGGMRGRSVGAENRRGEGRRPRDRSKKRPAAEDTDVQSRHVSAIGSEDEDGVQWYP